jgi:hypothetical protein
LERAAPRACLPGWVATADLSADVSGCEASLQPHVHEPHGSVEYSGFTRLPPGATSQVNFEYFLAGTRGTSVAKTFVGPSNIEYNGNIKVHTALLNVFVHD